MRTGGVAVVILASLLPDAIQSYVSNSRLHDVKSGRKVFGLSHPTTIAWGSLSPDDENKRGAWQEDDEKCPKEVGSPNPMVQVQRQIAASALVGLLWMAPPLLTLSSTPESAFAAPAPAPTTVTAATPAAPAKSKPAPAPAPAPVLPAEKRRLDDARESLQTATKKLTQLTQEVEKAKTELGTSSQKSVKAEQTAEKLIKTVDSEVAKLSSLKKTGDREVIVPQKDKVGM